LTTGSCSGSGVLMAGYDGADGEAKRHSNAVIPIHPGPPLAVYSLPLRLEPAADMPILLPQQDTGYVIRNLYCLPILSYVH
jgi:hypothetical protein